MTSIVGKKYYGSQWCPRSAIFPTFFRISSFSVQQNKDIHTGLELLEGE